MKNRLKITGIALTIALSIALFSFSSFVDNYFEINKNIDIFTTLYKEVNTYYVDDVEPGQFIRKGIDAMLNSLDPYTDFISESESEDYRFQITGQYGGIGALIATREDYTMITEPYENAPAAKAGLRAGDLLIEVDSKSLKGLKTDEVSKLLKGQPGTAISVKIKREGEGILTKKITREEIKINNVRYYGLADNETGYIKLTGFTNNAGLEVREALKELKEKHGIKSVILDLRGNPGGLLHEAVNVVNVFVDRNQLVVNTRGKVKELDREYRTLGSGGDLEIPLVVLTNRGSASASEIVSGTMQDLDRGVVIGQRTFGKGLVQSTRPLSYGTQLKITTQKYYTPSGRCIQALDYSNRNEDGSVGQVPDSLKKTFQTKAGRTVKDGGGIDPDINLEPRTSSQIARSLVGKYLIFDFATQYVAKHDKIASVRDYNFSDADWKEFKKFLEGKDYAYLTETEKALEEWKTKAQKENYYTALEEDYKALKQKLMHDKDEDLRKSEEEIRTLLQDEIIKRYYFQKGLIENSFSRDKDVQEALKLLKDSARYRGILSGKG